MNRRYLVTGAAFGLLAVIFGAFAAHGLKPILSSESLSSFETGVRFQMYHAILLLILGSGSRLFDHLPGWIYYFLFLGVVLFSGSIYLLATNLLTSFDFTVIALITPLGGSLLIISWAVLVWHFIKLKKK